MNEDVLNTTTDLTVITEPEMMPEARNMIIDVEAIREANVTLQKYRAGKARLDNRIVENERWYKLRHWENMRASDNDGDPQPVSAWLLNSIANKHADAIDNYPKASILPREQADEQTAKTLSSILPMVLEMNGFEQTYSDVWWKKLKTGTGVYGVFWDSSLHNGLGDVAVRCIDVLNVYWEPGVTDIQQSKNIFITRITDNSDLEDEYGEKVKGKLSGKSVDMAEYVHDESIDTSDKSVVVDWYYKKSGLLHFVKYVNDIVLYSSEDDETLSGAGFYDHGLYPIVFDVQFVEEDSPAGFGYLDVCKSAQAQIDKLNQVVFKNAVMAGRPRFFIRGGAGVNEEEYADWTRDFVHLTGASPAADLVSQIQVNPVDGNTLSILQSKIDELKETSGNRDFSQGGTTNGVTAASAIAALQEVGNKLSRDMLKSSYRAFKRVTNLAIELIRQFYDEPRTFRIVGEGETEYLSFDNRGIKPQAQGIAFGMETGYRMPVFDISIQAEKANSFSTLAQNELAKEFYSAGFFNPQLADQALACVEMMNFEGKDKIIEKIKSNGTMYQQIQQLQQQLQQLAQIVDAQNGTTIGAGMQEQQMTGGAAPGQANGETVTVNSLGAETGSEPAIVTRARQRSGSVM